MCTGNRQGIGRTVRGGPSHGLRRGRDLGALRRVYSNTTLRGRVASDDGFCTKYLLYFEYCTTTTFVLTVRTKAGVWTDERSLGEECGVPLSTKILRLFLAKKKMIRLREATIKSSPLPGRPPPLALCRRGPAPLPRPRVCKPVLAPRAAARRILGAALPAELIAAATHELVAAVHLGYRCAARPALLHALVLLQRPQRRALLRS